MYAIVKTGGKQYRVEEGQSLLVERLPVDDGSRISLEPLLYVDGETMLDGAQLADVQVQARVLAHERGPKLRIVKFKPKRGYKRRTGHRQELTRIEVTGIEHAGRRAGDEQAHAAPAGTPETAAGTPETVAGTPETVAGTPETVAGTPETVAGTPETVAGTPETVAGTPETVAGTPETVAGTPEPQEATDGT